MAQPLLAAFHPVGGVEAARVNATVDGGVADSVRAAFMTQTVLDLLRRPVLLQKQAFNQGKPFWVIELALAAAGFAPLLVTRLRLACTVGFAVAVAFDLARDGGLVSHQRGGNGGDAPAPGSLNHDVFPFG